MRAGRSIAGALWVIAGVGYLVAEAVTASAFPGYSYSQNDISDLGSPVVGVFHGRDIDSPLHAVMNSAFVAQGILFALAGLLAVHAVWDRNFAPRRRIAFQILVVVIGIGMILVGLFHGDQASIENGLANFHYLGALMAIGGGNAALIVAGSALRGAAYKTAGLVSMALGIVGLVFLVMMPINFATTAFHIPGGALERGSVYTMLVWQLVAGALLLTRFRSLELHGPLPRSER